MNTNHHHPATLAAITATWTLAKSRAHLALLVQGEALDRARRAAIPRDGLRSQVLGRRTALGGHADPVAGIADTSSSGSDRPGPMARLAESVDTTIAWMFQAGPVLTGYPPAEPVQQLAEIRRWVVTVKKPSTAAHVADWLTEADDKIRTTLGLLPDHLPVPGNLRCPACRVRMLRIVTSAPDTAQWVIVCTNADCTCVEDPLCRCGMPVQARGAAHIWDRSTELVDGLLRQLPRRRVRTGRRTVVDVDQADQVEEVAA